jgi:hypothetical protein
VSTCLGSLRGCERLARELYEQGAKALPALLAEMATGEHAAQRVIGELVASQRSAEPRPLLLEALEADARAPRLAVIRALGSSSTLRSEMRRSPSRGSSRRVFDLG